MLSLFILLCCLHASEYMAYTLWPPSSVKDLCTSKGAVSSPLGPSHLHSSATSGDFLALVLPIMNVFESEAVLGADWCFRKHNNGVGPYIGVAPRGPRMIVNSLITSLKYWEVTSFIVAMQQPCGHGTPIKTLSGISGSGPARFPAVASHSVE